MQHHLLLVAALLLGFIGVLHSYLGERHVLGRLLALPNLPELRGSRVYMESILRWAWHLTSVAWWGSSVLILFLWGRQEQAVLGAVLAGTFAVHGVIILAKVGPRHPAWPLFFLAAASLWFGSR
jgi:hypothetical protein